MTVHTPRSYTFKVLLEAVQKVVPVDEIARQSTELEPFGSSAKAWFTGRCPLPDHADRDPSFYIYPADHPGGRWYCYGCSRGGDVLDLYMSMHSLEDFRAALIGLAGECGVLETMPGRPQGWHVWSGEKFRRREKLRDALARSYQRRYFRMFASDFATIEDPTERRRECAAFWRDLWPLACIAAEWRLSR